MVAFEAFGIPEVAGLLGQVDRELGGGLKDRLKQAVKLVQSAVRARVDSRRLKGTISAAVSVRSLIDFEARVYPRGKWSYIARFLEGGTRPHVIPNFHGRDGVVFQHPGSRPHPMFAPAFEETEDQVVELVGIPPVLR